MYSKFTSDRGYFYGGYLTLLTGQGITQTETDSFNRACI